MIGAGGNLLEAGPRKPPTSPPSAPPARRGFETDAPVGGTTRWNQGGTWPTGDRRTSCVEFRAAYKSCPWLSASIDVVARTITAGGVVVTPDEDAEQVYADDPEARPSDGAQGSAFDRDGTKRSPGKPGAGKTPPKESVAEAVLAARKPRRTDDRGATDQQATPDEPDDDQPVPGEDVEDNRPQADRRQTGNPPREPLAPPEVEDLRAFLAFCNPREDIRQILRGVLTDLQTYGDAFLELTWLLGKPAGLYSLDSPSMVVVSDEHGKVEKYVQDLGDARTVEFSPHQVIHIAMDSPDGSLYGYGTAAKAMMPVTVWLYTAALLRQKMKMGDPPTIHAHFGLETTDADIRKWRDEYRTTVIGVENFATPITTVGRSDGKPITELQARQHTNLLEILQDARDTIVSTCGVTPSKVGIIESGNLGGGTGTEQDRTFRVNTCGPLEQLVMEKLNYALLQAFGIDGWSMSFEDMDWRDDKELEEIRDMRLRSGAWTLNRYLADIGEPLVDPVYGDVHAILPHTPTEAQLWDDLPTASGLAIDQMRQAAKPTPTPGVPSVDKDGNPVPPGHPTQVPPGHPAATKAVKDEKDAQAEQMRASLAASQGAAALPGQPQPAATPKAPATPAPKPATATPPRPKGKRARERARGDAIDAVRAHAVLVLAEAAAQEDDDA